MEDVKLNNAVVKSNVIFEDNDFQNIAFSYSTNVANANGFILYSKSDHIITTLEYSYNRINPLAAEKENLNGKKYLTFTEKTTVRYEEYKTNGKYYPARVIIKKYGRNDLEGKSYPFSFEQSLIYRKKVNSNYKGLKNKIDLTKALTDNIPTNEVAVSTALLSKAEQVFIEAN